MKREIRNTAVSVRARLLNRAKQRDEVFDVVLQRYATERFLARLSQSAHRERLVLKGAMLLVVWGGESFRPTRDLDFLGHGAADPSSIAACVAEICRIGVEDDGLRFLADEVEAREIRIDSDYGGVRVLLTATLEQARIRLQIDVGFGGDVVPAPQIVEFPTLLGGPGPRVRAYARETTIAEKFEAAVSLGARNSRLKDFYDLHVLPRAWPFDGPTLVAAVRATFEKRRTQYPASIVVAVPDDYFASESTIRQWRGYLAKNRLTGAPADFEIVRDGFRAFLGPVLEAAAGRGAALVRWEPGGPWR